MIDIREPKYQWGQPVNAVIDLINDGSFPDAEDGALLVASGTRGEIVQTGMHEESNIPVYIVEFPNGKIVGCLEEELEPA
ncbi:MAG: nitrogen fixation protein NifZ [Sideroxydans sp.]|nr:nitrogen fixation protein NifZ [Sideroxydans sp.]